MVKTAERMSSQCKLVQPTEGGKRLYVAWIPKEKAMKGRWVRIEGMEGDWQVEEVWGTRPEAFLIENERNYKKQRDASDIDKVPDRIGHMEF